MKLNTRSLGCLATLALLFAVSTPAQKLQIPAKGHGEKAATKAEIKAKTNASPDATQTCTYSFSSGSGQTYLQFCVSVNGNIVNFDSPNGVEQLDQGGAFEGYGICDTSTAVGYYDYAYADSGNWNAPTTVTHTATLVKIERTTSDALWTLTQTITSVAGTNPYAKVAMALKNNSASTKEVALFRYGNVDNDQAAATDDYAANYDGTNDSAWGYSAFASDSPYGLMLQNVGNPTPATVPYDRNGFATATIDGPSPCSINATPTIYNGIGSAVYWYLFALNKEQSVTVTTRYISF